jgi:zinc transport system substrate-binding protein
MPELTRRQIIASGLGTVTAGSVTGCLSDGSDNAASAGENGEDEDSSDTGSGNEEETPVAKSSFFVFGDFAKKVAGETAEAETLVPVGQHGHGWEPGPQIQGEILEGDIFLHGAEGFQPWADDLVESLRSDDADVRLVSVAEGIELAEGGHDHGGEEEGHDHEEGHSHEAEESHDHEHEESEDSHEEGHEHGEEGHEQEHEGEEEHDHESEGEHEGEHSHEGEGEEHEGEHDHREEHNHEGEGEHEHEGESEESGHGHGHDHGGTDPHFWLDPGRAKQAVGNISEAFAEVEDGNAEVYDENADEYRSRLDELDEKYSSELGDAPKDVVFVAGHDAFGYLAERYGFRVETLTGLSPDDRPTPRDIERAQEIISEHDLQYVCSDPLESQRAANQLVEETDAEEVLPLTAIPGQTEEWEENGWGYVELMENVNLNTLRRALGVE